MLNDNEVLKLYNALPSLIHTLLSEYSRGDSTTPDYAGFIDAIYSKLLKPLATDGDERFHSGAPNDTYWLVIRRIAEIKYEIYKKCRKQGDEGEYTQKDLSNYKKLKLLTMFFEKKTSSGFSFNKFVELEYLFSVEKDEQKQNELIKKAQEKFGNSSTADYLQAKMLVSLGQYEQALSLCKESLDKFPENTPVYALQSEIYRLMSERAVNEGLAIEPRDVNLQSMQKINQFISGLRTKFKSGDLSEDEFIEELNNFINKNLDISNIDFDIYLQVVNSQLKSASVLDDKSSTFLLTGEYLLDNLPKEFDFSPVSIQFCKAVETELQGSLFDPFKTKVLNDRDAIRRANNDNDIFENYIFENKSMALGQMAWILKNTSKDKNIAGLELRKSFKQHIEQELNSNVIFGDRGLLKILTMNKVNKYRNGAAHSSIIPKDRAIAAREWSYNNLNIISGLLN